MTGGQLQKLLDRAGLERENIMIRYGTHYFVSRRAVQLYFECDDVTVDRKLSEGSVAVGKPPAREGYVSRVIVDEGRYEMVQRS